MDLSRHKAAAVHLYTSSGIVFSFMAALALLEVNARLFLVSLFLAVVVDATDGMLARRYRASEVLPAIDGRRMDDIIDYLTFVFLPCLGFVVFRVIEPAFAFVAVLPMIASVFGFSNRMAKLDEAFLGFPSYWNIAFLYLYVLPVPPQAVAALLVLLSLLVFVPVRYIYPTKIRRLRKLHLAMGGVCGIAAGLVCLFPGADWARPVLTISLIYPGFYMADSLIRHYRFPGVDAVD
jgi:phosphatidylcholine synthase